jgi:hypothetical protein
MFSPNLVFYASAPIFFAQASALLAVADMPGDHTTLIGALVAGFTAMLALQTWIIKYLLTTYREGMDKQLGAFRDSMDKQTAAYTDSTNKQSAAYATLAARIELAHPRPRKEGGNS